MHEIEVRREWFGQFEPRVGDEFRIAATARVVQIREETISVSSFASEAYISGEITITLQLHDLGVHPDDVLNIAVARD